MGIIRFIFFRVIRLWNQLPADIVGARNFEAFIAKLTHFRLSSLMGVDGHPVCH